MNPVPFCETHQLAYELVNYGQAQGYECTECRKEAEESHTVAWLDRKPVQMTKDEYREHMRKYSRETAHMSFVVYKHPDYQALQAAGDEIIPWLLRDMLDPNWHCDACHGQGYEFAPGWEQEWVKDKVYLPRSTGNPCPKCKGKGNICSWACMHLLFEKTRARGDAPEIEEWMRGRHDALTKLWRKWGEQRGYLPAVPDEPGALAKIGRAILGVFRLWAS
jgi:hypothetical protein